MLYWTFIPYDFSNTIGDAYIKYIQTLVFQIILTFGDMEIMVEQLMFMMDI